MTDFIRELRAYAADHNPSFAVSANVGYLGNLVGQFGALWGCIWGPHVDFVLMENDYRVGQPSPHLLLPAGRSRPGTGWAPRSTARRPGSVRASTFRSSSPRRTIAATTS